MVDGTNGLRGRVAPLLPVGVGKGYGGSSRSMSWSLGPVIGPVSRGRLAYDGLADRNVATPVCPC